MKTIKEIKLEIAGLLEILPNANKNEAKKIKSRLKILKDCVMYLETNPRDEFIKENYDNLKKRIEIIDSRFNEWFKAIGFKPKNPKTTWNKLNNMSLLKFQLYVLKYYLIFRYL